MQKHSFRKSVARVLVVALLAGTAPTNAFALATIGGQMVNAAQLAELIGLATDQVAGQATHVNQTTQIARQDTQIEKQIEQIDQMNKHLKKQIEIYKNMQQNTKGLSDPAWSAAVEDLAALVKASQEAQGVSFVMDTVESFMTNAYPSYNDLSADAKKGESVSEQYQAWSDATRNTLFGAMNAAGLGTDLFGTEAKVLAELRGMSISSEGRMQVLQIGHELAAQQIEQTQKLRQLVSTQISQMSNWALSEQGQADIARVESEAIFGTRTSTRVTIGEDGSVDINSEVETVPVPINTSDGSVIGGVDK